MDLLALTLEGPLSNTLHMNNPSSFGLVLWGLRDLFLL